MASVRELLLQWSRVKAPRVQEPDDAVGLALEELLWTVEGLHVVVDGWALFRIIRESADSMDAVGLMAWLSLSHSKQWNSVYLYASGDEDPPRWNWGRQYQGFLSIEGPKPAGVP